MYFIWFRSLRALSNAVLVSKSCLSVSSSLRERRGEGRETKEEREEKERREWKLKNTRVCISSFFPLLTYISPLKSERENSCTRACIHVHVHVYITCILYSRKFWRELNLANLAF